ncbi:MAG TPA: winged helix-turn-helix domain-containing protein [Terriglobales bacterium]|nr:winged helix-turn-helix domain-containing protein [Terriglobales bacterium]
MLRFGNFELDTESGELRKAGHKISLRPQAVKILILLATRSGQLVSREQLKDEVWGAETFVDFEHGLNLCIREIRAALDDNANTPRYIETLPRRGYRFIAQAQISNGVEQLGLDQQAMPTWQKSRFVTARYIAPALIFLGIVLGLASSQYRRLPWVEDSKPARTIAVLPLQNLSGETEEYFADGMTEALTTDLARMETLQVISRTSAMQYKGVKKPLPVIARELKADVIVEGSVQRSGDRVKITAQLIRAADDKHLWADSYERDLRDILSLQDEVASDIAKQIQARLGGPAPATVQRAKSRFGNPEAYETYLKANYYLDRFDLAKSIDHYNQAIKLDPDFAPAYAHLARAYFFLAFFGAVPPGEGWGKVKQSALLAVQKDDRLPEAHGALALAKLHSDWDFPGAEKEFKLALALNPNDADIRHDYAHYLMVMGRVAESQQESTRAVELDPMGDGLNSCLCWHSFAARDYEQSVRLATNFLKAKPNDPWEHTILGWTYEQMKMPEKAIAEFEQAVKATQGDKFFLAALGHAYAVGGHRRKAMEVLETLNAQAKRSYVSPFDLALLHIALGEKTQAFALLDKAVAERSTFVVYSKWEPRLDPLRSDPRFTLMMQRIGLPLTP